MKTEIIKTTKWNIESAVQHCLISCTTETFSHAHRASFIQDFVVSFMTSTSSTLAFDSTYYDSRHLLLFPSHSLLHNILSILDPALINAITTPHSHTLKTPSFFAFIFLHISSLIRVCLENWNFHQHDEIFLGKISDRLR
jgi:hypothetical protein